MIKKIKIYSGAPAEVELDLNNFMLFTEVKAVHYETNIIENKVVVTLFAWYEESQSQN